VKIKELAQALECYVMPNRMGDAVDLAAIIDTYVRDRIAEGFAPTTSETAWKHGPTYQRSGEQTEFCKCGKRWPCVDAYTPEKIKGDET
jgi:hypothetical protein